MSAEGIRGRTIRETGERWASSLVDRIWQGEPVITIIRNEEDYLRRLEFPSLSSAEGLISTFPPLFNPSTGEIFIQQWRSVEVETLDGKQAIKRPEGYRVLGKKVRDLAKLPVSIRVEELILARVEKGLEPAIRMASYILDSHTSLSSQAEVPKIQRAVAAIQDLSNRYLKGKITRENIKDLARETLASLETEGLLPVKDETKIKMVVQMTRALNLDSLGRLNPMVGQIHARSAFLKAIRRIVIAQQVVDKYSVVMRILLFERETSRWALKQAIKELDTLAGISKRGHVAFEGIIEVNQLEIIKRLLAEIANKYLVLPVAVPYVGPARAAQALLTGRQPGSEEITNRSLVEYHYSHFEPDLDIETKVFSPDSAIELIKQGNFLLAKEKIRIAYNLLKLSLQQHEQIW